MAEGESAVDEGVAVSESEGAGVSAGAEVEDVEDVEAEVVDAEIRTSSVAGLTNLPSGANVAVLPVTGVIRGFTLESLKRRVDRAINRGQASLIVFEFDTPGGQLDAALRISRYIKSLNVPTVAWVRDEAYSAGILIASACDEIIMSPASATGDCAPIIPGMSLNPTERAKALSPLLEEFRDNAQNNGYDYALFHAMCVLEVELYEIEFRATGERRLVNQADYAWMVNGEEIEKRPINTADEGAAIGLPVRNKSLDAERGRWTMVQQVHDGQTLLTLSQSRALGIGLSRATVGTESELSGHFGAAAVGRVPETWSERLASVLVNPIVKAILVVLFMVGLFIEFQSPGLGVGGVIAAVAGVGLIGLPFLVGLAETWHVVAFVLGIVFLAMEVFVLPGFGFFGVGGLVLMLVGIIFAAVPTSGVGPVPLPQRGSSGVLLASAIWTMMGLCGGIAGVVMLARNSEKIGFLDKLVLKEDEAMVAARMKAEAAEAAYEAAVPIGAEGRVVAALHPAGRVVLDGHEEGEEPIDVVCDGGFVDAGARVKVVAVNGNRVVVEEVV